MLVAAFSWGDLWRLALAVFLLAVGLSSAYLLVRLGGTVGRLSAFISGAEREILPVINKVGGSVDRVNGQLDKVDKITDSAVDAAQSVDTAVRTVSAAVTLLGCRDDDDDLSVVVAVEPDAVLATVGPFTREALAELEHDGSKFGL